MSYFEAAILGLVQGLAEFLPISSSGHLALLQHFFGIKGDTVLFFTIMLHVGTLVSVFIVYWKDISELIVELCAVISDIFRGRGLRVNANETRRLGFMIIVATIPTCIIGLLFNDFFESLYTTITAIGICLLITGTALFVAERFPSSDRLVGDMKFRHAVLVGIFQGIAICPGISRSGSTLVGSLLCGVKRDFAAKFIFLISIPSILGSVILEVPHALESGLDSSLLGPIALGVLVSALSGLAAIKVMIRLISNKKLIVFSAYTWLVGAAVVIYSCVH